MNLGRFLGTYLLSISISAHWVFLACVSIATPDPC